MKVTTTLGALALAALASLTPLGPVEAATRAKLMGPDLKPREVNVQTLREGVLTYFDNERNLQAESASRFLQLRFEPTPSVESARGAAGNPVDSGAVELIDGQRLVGRLTGVSADGQELQWQHPQLGLVTVPLERVAALALAGVLSTAATPATDQVELANGDIAAGFVEKIVDQQVQLKPEGEGAMLMLPLGGVRTLRLANPRREPASPGYTLWLADGSRLRAAGIRMEDDRFTLVEPALAMPQAQPLAAALVQRLDLAAGTRRLVDLADLPYTILSGGEVFGVTASPRRVGIDLALHAPLTLAWELPAGSRRFMAVFRLLRDSETSPAVQAWSDCRVVIRAGEQVLAEHRLWSGQARVEINLPLRQANLTVELDSAINGPVMDRILMEQAAVLISE